MNYKFNINLLSIKVSLFLLILGISSFAASAKSLNIPVTNASFENGMEGWSFWDKFEGQISVQSGEAHSGSNALLIDAREKNNNPIATQSVEVQGGATYHLAVWARVAPDSAPITAAVKIEGYTADGKNVDQLIERIRLAEGNVDEWQLLTATLPLSPDTVRASLLLRIYGKGAVLFDDVTLETSGISVVSPTKKALPIGVSEKINYELKLHYPWKSTFIPKISADLYDGDKLVHPKLPISVKRGENERQFFAIVSAKVKTAGDYQLHFSLQQDGQEMTSYFPAEIFTEVANRKPEYLTDNGTILHNGKPFFPISIYHPGFTDEIFQQLTERGFNTIVSGPNFNVQELKPVLDRAQKYGLAMDVPLHGYGRVGGNLQESLEKIRQFADHPAVLSWKILDEPMYNMKVSREIPQVYRALKATDKKHPLELTLSPGDDLEFYKSFSDIIQRDVYPLPSHPLTDVSDVAAKTYQSKQPWQNLAMVLPSGWTPDLKTQPTAAQARSMVYLALINGAKAISWYSMFDPGWDLRKTPLWEYMKEINGEITKLSEPLMLGEIVQSISADNKKVLFTARKYDGKLYILLTNPEDTLAEITLNIPANASPKRRKQTLSLKFDGVDSRTIIIEK